MKAYERFIKYIGIDTNADEKCDLCPSTENQWKLAHMLVEELKEIGIGNAYVDDKCYVYAKIPAKCIDNKIGFISHMDTAPACPGGPINHEIINYSGGDIVLQNGLTIENKEFSFLDDLIGNDLIVTDGNTLLGADDKAGIAIIMTLAEKLMQNIIPEHCEVLIAFTPDEEIGRGADFFNVKKFGADFAYTVDGGALGELEYENFNAASAKVTINGVNIHPGSAKGKMKNAARIAAKFESLIPEFDRPEYTEGYEGFFHLCEFSGNEELAEMDYIIRDHDMIKFENRKKTFRNIADFINLQYGENTVKIEIKDNYYNMKEKVLACPKVLDIAKSAYEKAGVSTRILPIRGGTDGSRLSFMGLVSPNLSTGGYNGHSRKEMVSIQSMEKMVDVLINIASHK